METEESEGNVYIGVGNLILWETLKGQSGHINNVTFTAWLLQLAHSEIRQQEQVTQFTIWEEYGENLHYPENEEPIKDEQEYWDCVTSEGTNLLSKTENVDEVLPCKREQNTDDYEMFQETVPVKPIFKSCTAVKMKRKSSMRREGSKIKVKKQSRIIDKTVDKLDHVEEKKVEEISCKRKSVDINVMIDQKKVDNKIEEIVSKRKSVDINVMLDQKKVDNKIEEIVSKRNSVRNKQKTVKGHDRFRGIKREKIDGKMCYICQFCEKLYFQLANLKDHINQHHTEIDKKLTFVCEHCGREFTTRTSLNSHRHMSHKLINQTLECDGCKYKTHHIQALNRHKYCCHPKEVRTRDFLCDKCTYRGFRADDVRRHIANVHFLEKRFKCSWEGCGKAFGRVDNLRVHALKHTGEKPVRCQHCDYRCNQKAALLWHVKKHHPGQQVPYSVGRMFPKSDNVEADLDTSYPVTRIFPKGEKLKADLDTSDPVDMSQD